MRMGHDVADLLVRLDPSYSADRSPDGSLLVRIHKAIYGLGESSRRWNIHLTETLRGLGFAPLDYDKCVFTHKTKDIIDCIICVHVDDLLVLDLSGKLKQKQALVAGITSKYGKVTLHDGQELIYLGVRITLRDTCTLLDQQKLIELLEYQPPAKHCEGPAVPSILNRSSASPAATDPAKYRSTLMRILYIATKTRPDVLFATNVLAARQHCCSKDDEEHLARLVRYLRHTASWKLVLAPTDAVLKISADASYACHHDAKGHSGFLCSLGGSTIFARSVKQKLVAKSSSEAELLAVNLAADECIYLRHLLEELGYPQSAPTVILQDNNSAIIMAGKAELGTKRTKHFTVRHYFIRQHIDSGDITLRHQPGSSMLADGLTKPLVGGQAIRWGERLLGLARARVRGGVLDVLDENSVTNSTHGVSSSTRAQGIPSLSPPPRDSRSTRGTPSLSLPPREVKQDPDRSLKQTSSARGRQDPRKPTETSTRLQAVDSTRSSTNH
jgi:hypothetical protein